MSKIKPYLYPLSKRDPYPYPRLQNDDNFRGKLFVDLQRRRRLSTYLAQLEEPWRRINRHHTLSSLRHEVCYFDPCAPEDSLDFIIKSVHNHGLEFLKDKNEVLLQRETLNWPHGRVLKNRTFHIQSCPSTLQVSKYHRRDHPDNVKVAILEARPSGLSPSFSFSGVIGGVDAQVGEFPWQLSQQRLGGSWSHSCGASLLSATKALSAAHCVSGSAVATLRVVAGLHKRSDMTGTQISNVARYVVHEGYNNGQASTANDIAILHLQTTITTNFYIQYATLPSNNNNNFAGTTCVISGWGRDSTSQTLPDTLQKADMRVLTTGQCSTAVDGIGTVWDSQICVQSTDGQSGSCNGDSGGPLNCPNGSNVVVAGVTSWVVANILGHCLPAYPSVYTRTGSYLTWINSN